MTHVTLTVTVTVCDGVCKYLCKYQLLSLRNYFTAIFKCVQIVY